jgi:glycosyltransferase involved in cell wall biosynthesis
VQGVITAQQRPRVCGKFLFVGDRKIYVRGVTYGAFRPDEDGNEYHRLDLVDRDFALMAANGMNAVRIPHTTPPRSLLDIAQQHGLRVMVGLSAEQYVGYLIDKKDAPNIEELVRARVSACAGHPALLCYAIGNEIPASIVRWLGHRRVERYLEQMYKAIKAEDADGLVSYVNYPTTEYLQLPFLDILSFNVYLEARDRLEAYLARLQTIAGDRPLIMSEVGLDSLRKGEEKQAHVLEWQVRATFAAGCAGAFIFAWTDDWYRGDAVVDDWAFGLTTRERQPKPALAAARRAFAESPFASEIEWPRVSVAVCTYNGSRTLDECLAALERLDYPDYEVIVVNDGSTDATAVIAARYRCRLISTENRGLSNARNTALAEATGSIVAYLDDDAYPDPHWLRYFALTFLESPYGAVGGPNLAPPGDGWIADCVANSPGNPTHVLLSDRDAEHIPGCNMAFRKTALEAVGGFDPRLFDPRFCVAGDDVDLCWRLTDAGFTLGFSPAAMVWHHRRNSLRAFWRQQRGYGRAEGMLERWWPGRHDEEGHVAWTGRIYGRGLVRALSWGRSRVYHGVWGAAPFQSLYEPASGGWGTLVQSPVWYLLTAALGAISILGLDWTPLRFAFVPLLMAVGALLVQAGKNAAHAVFHPAPLRRWDVLRRRVVTALLYLVQPVARLAGRLGYAFWNRHWWGEAGLRPLWPHTTATWTEQWQDPAARLTAIEEALRDAGAPVRRGGEFDRWDIQVRWGSLGAARLLLGVEDHDLGHQLVRVRVWPRWPLRGPLLTSVFGGLALGAARANAWTAAVVLGGVAAFVGLRTVVDLMAALSVTRRALRRLGLAGP